MSHYIQDNQCVIKTADNRILLLIKGGDNNTFSYENKRCSSWWFQGVYKDEKSFNNFIDNIVATDVNGGMWQFNSLKGKFFKGFTEYDNIVYERFNRALKNALYLPQKISEIDANNISQYEDEITALMQSKKFSLNDEDGCFHSISLYSHYYDKTNEEKLRRVSKIIDYPEKELYKGYRLFCKTYKNIPIKEALKESDFCKQLGVYRDDWGGLNRIPKNAEISNENFVYLMENNISTILDMWDSELISLFESFPIQMKYVLDTTDIMEKLFHNYKEIPDDHWKKSPNLKNIELIKSFIEKYDDYLKKFNEKLQSKKAKAENVFIETWNSLVELSYYKNTDEKLEKALVDLKESLELGEFDLLSLRGKVDKDFIKIPSYHRNQYKKNQKAIEKAFKELISKYYVLFDDDDIDLLCGYFKLEKPKKPQDTSIKTKQKKEQQSLFNFVA